MLHEALVSNELCVILESEELEHIPDLAGRKLRRDVRRLLLENIVAFSKLWGSEVEGSSCLQKTGKHVTSLIR